MRGEFAIQRDKKHINLARSWDVNHWCEELNLHADELKEIVRAVGPDVEKVRDFMAKKQLLNWTAHIN